MKTVWREGGRAGADRELVLRRARGIRSQWKSDVIAGRPVLDAPKAVRGSGLVVENELMFVRRQLLLVRMRGLLVEMKVMVVQMMVIAVSKKVMLV